MADWMTLANYIRSNYKVEEDHGDMMSLLFNVGDGRTQRVLVHDAGNNWATVSTAVCLESDISARDALVRNSNMRIGGLALIDDGGPVVFKHAFPLANLDVSEFEEPLDVVVGFGDALEKELTGGVDRF